MDEFENDRFIVDYDEEEEEGDQDGKDRQKSKKNKKRLFYYLNLKMYLDKCMI